MRLIHVCVLAACAAACSTTMVWAQDRSIQFRLEPDAANSTECHEIDNDMSRVHTLAIKGDQAEIMSAGGLQHKLTMERPNVYSGDTKIGTTSLRIMADLGATPPTLTVTKPRCKWNARFP